MNNGDHCNEFYVKELFIHLNRKFNMAGERCYEGVSTPEISAISNAGKEKECECCHKLKQERNMTLQELS